MMYAYLGETLYLVNRGSERLFRFFGVPGQFKLLDIVPDAKNNRLQTGLPWPLEEREEIDLARAVDQIDRLPQHEGGWRDLTSDDWVIKQICEPLENPDSGPISHVAVKEHTGFSVLTERMGLPNRAALYVIFTAVDPRWYINNLERTARLLPLVSNVLDEMPIDIEYASLIENLQIARDLVEFGLRLWYNELEPDHALDPYEVVMTDRAMSYVREHIGPP